MAQTACGSTTGGCRYEMNRPVGFRMIDMQDCAVCRVAGFSYCVGRERVYSECDMLLTGNSCRGLTAFVPLAFLSYQHKFQASLGRLLPCLHLFGCCSCCLLQCGRCALGLLFMAMHAMLHAAHHIIYTTVVGIVVRSQRLKLSCLSTKRSG
jgi:hypothetical protein